MSLDFINELAGLSTFRGNIRSAVAAYSESIDEFYKNVNVESNGRLFSIYNGISSDSDFNRSEEILYFRDRLIDAVHKFATDLFDGINLSGADKASMSLVKFFDDSYIKKIPSVELRFSHLKETKTQIDHFMQKLLQTANEFDGKAGGLSLPYDVRQTDVLLRGMHPKLEDFDPTAIAKRPLGSEHVACVHQQKQGVEKSLSKSSSDGFMINFFISLRAVILKLFNWFVALFV